MEAGIGVCFPAVNIKVKAARSGNIAVHFLDDARNDFPLCLDIAGRSDDETQYSNMLLRRQRVLLRWTFWARGKGTGRV
jgi:hypothetical protein